jgi:hypothetical protein
LPAHRKDAGNAMQDGQTPDDLPRGFLKHMRHPQNQGALTNPNGSAEMTGQCGDSIADYLEGAGKNQEREEPRPSSSEAGKQCMGIAKVLAYWRALRAREV